MPNFPDWLYSFTPRDQQVTPLEIFNIRLTGSDNDTLIITESYQVPYDKVLCISSATARMTTDNPANSNPLSWWLRTSIDNSGTEDRSFALAGRYFGGAQQDSLDHLYDGQTSGGIYVQSGNFIWGEAQFDYDLLGAVNYLAMHVNGILIPRGNFAI